MKLLFDQGNSFLKWARSDTGLWETGRIRTGDSGQLENLLDTELSRPSDPTRIMICSVAGANRLDELVGSLRARFTPTPTVLTPSRKAYGIVSNYSLPETLGSDRWASLIAVFHRYRLPACVVDCGTAVTVDLLDPEGEFRGGTIVPGLALARNSLTSGTAKLRNGSDSAIDCLAKSTDVAIQTGTLLGIAGGINYIVDCQQKILGQKLNIYLTGGDAHAIAPMLGRSHVIVGDLVLQGLDVASELDA